MEPLSLKLENSFGAEHFSALLNAKNAGPKNKRIGVWLVFASAICDVVFYFLAFFFCPLLGIASGPAHPDFSFLRPGLLMALSFLFILRNNGAYHSQLLLRPRHAAALLLRGCFWWTALISLVVLLAPPALALPHLGRTLLASAAGCAGLLFARGLFHGLLRRLPVSHHLRQTVIFAGWSPEANEHTQVLWRNLADVFEVAGYVAEIPYPGGEEPPNVPYLGAFDDLPVIIRENHAEMVVLIDPNADDDAASRVREICEQEVVRFHVLLDHFPILRSGLSFEDFGGVPMLGISKLPLDLLANRALKRTIDIIGGIFGLCVFAPVIAVFALIVYSESPGPVFYRQRRLTRRGTAFDIIKIRSMRLDAEKAGAPGWTVRDDPRRLRIGAFMRRWNIDELPQFWNVIKGEMSLVGPRPERPELIARFKHEIEHYNARHYVKPGITGWAQVNGLRGDTCLKRRIQCDLFYIENWNPWLDLEIAIMTFFKRENAC